MSKLNRRDRRKQEAQGRKAQDQEAQDHKAQAKSPGQEAQDQAKAQGQEAQDQEAQDQTKAGLTVDKNITTGRVKVTDGKGKPVLTKDDMARIDKVKASQVKARELRQQLLEAQRQAKQDVEELNGSEAVKVLRRDLEGKIEAGAEVVRVNLERVNNWRADLKALTGLDKPSKARTGAGTSKANGNGRFNATVKANGDQVKVLVTHIATNKLFDTSIYTTNGTIRGDDWLGLRHRFIAFYEAPDHKAPADRALPARDYNLILRAYLSNLKGKVEAVKPII